MPCRSSGAIGLLGSAADAVGTAATMQVVCLLPLPGPLLSLALPDTREGAPVPLRV
jgi:hypothetical protein